MWHSGRDERCIQVLVGTREEKRPLGKPRRRLNKNIKIDHMEIDSGGVDWIDVVRYRGK
jgi:hypothetical protein